MKASTIDKIIRYGTYAAGAYFVGITIAGAIKRKRESVEGIGGYGHRTYGGNSGYDGYSMSKRAVYARSEGKYPKTDFKQIYGLSDAVFNFLCDCEIIMSYEWHHTSSWGNKTKFYEWDQDDFYDIYKNNKSEISSIVSNVLKAKKQYQTALDLAAQDKVPFEEYRRLENDYYAARELGRNRIFEIFDV